jgi:hypothetical protein
MCDFVKSFNAHNQIMEGYMGALKWNPTLHKKPKVLVTTSLFALSIVFFQ